MSGIALDELRGVAGVRRIVGNAAVRVAGVQSDSRLVQAGDLFAAVRGEQSDGSRFIADACRRGAVAVLADESLAHHVLEGDVPVVVSDDVRGALGPVSHAVYGHPTRALRTVGVTGTNGKTTVSYLLEGVISAAGGVPALLGTIALRGPGFEQEARLTTPEADVIARFASQQQRAGASHLVMEVSSHALSQGRAAGARFDVAVFTNLTQDHLDYHGSMEAYAEAKARLFTEYAPASSVIMVDAAFGRSLAGRAVGHVLRCSTDANADAELRVRSWRSTREGIHAVLHTPRGELTLESPLFGGHNLENLLVTVAAAQCLDIDDETIRSSLARESGAPGRMERVADQRDVMVLVDYAHTPDAVERAVAALKPLTTGRLFAVCGCGGDRDKKKRAPMAEAAARHADVVVLTSDNPRTEDPLQILADMEPGARNSRLAQLDAAELGDASRGYVVIADRAQAIACAIAAAKAGDTVLLAGKGHETYQIVGKFKRPFDDRVEARRAIARAGGGDGDTDSP